MPLLRDGRTAERVLLVRMAGNRLLQLVTCAMLGRHNQAKVPLAAPTANAGITPKLPTQVPVIPAPLEHRAQVRALPTVTTVPQDFTPHWMCRRRAWNVPLDISGQITQPPVVRNVLLAVMELRPVLPPVYYARLGIPNLASIPRGVSYVRLAEQLLSMAQLIHHVPNVNSDGTAQVMAPRSACRVEWQVIRWWSGLRCVTTVSLGLLATALAISVNAL